MITFSEQAIIALSISIAHLSLLGYLVSKKGLTSALPNYLSGYLSLAALWGLIVFDQSNPIPTLPFTQQSVFFPPVIMAFLIWNFTEDFLGRETEKRWFTLGVSLIVLVIIVADFGLIAPPFLSSPGDGAAGYMSIAFWLSVISIGAIFGSAAFSCLQAQNQTYSPRHRNRILILLLTLGVIGLGIEAYLSLVPVIQEIGLIIQWLGGPVLIFILLNQNLPDINTGLRNFIKFSVVNAITIAFYGIIIYALQVFLADVSNGFLWVTAIGVLLFTTFYLPLHRFTEQIVARVLFRHRYNNELVIRNYIQAINNIIFITDLTSVSLSFIQENLNIRRGAYFLLRNQDANYYHFTILTNLNGDLPKTVRLKKNTSITSHLIDDGQSISQYRLDVFPEFDKVDTEGVQALKAMNFEQYVPIKRNHVFIGIIALGPFASGAPYTLQDVDLFSTLAAQTAIALENARLFDNVRQNLEEITRIKGLMDNVFASIKSGVITASTTDEILLVNEAAYRILNLPVTIQPGGNIRLIMQGLNDTALPALFRDVKATERSYHGYQISLIIPDRGPVNLSVDLTPIRDAQKRLKGVAMVINDMTEETRLMVVQDLFRRYLSPAVVDRLPSDPSQLKLGGQRQEVSILFADIRGFSTFSEQQDPEDLINILNRYLSMAAESILVYEGTLDKFMGDAVMAVFNAPLAQDDHPMRAVKAAAAMQQAICDYHRFVGRNAPQLDFGVGIHVGEAVVGNVGTNSRMDYTAVGDAVNLAKRIQENTPGGKILLSQSTYDRVHTLITAVPYQRLTLKGRQEPEQTYELLNVQKQ